MKAARIIQFGKIDSRSPQAKEMSDKSIPQTDSVYPSAAGSDWKRLLFGTAAGLTVIVLWASLLGQPDFTFATILFQTQDLVCAIGLIGILCLLALLPATIRAPRITVAPYGILAAVTLAAALASYAGARLVFFGEPLTRDEAMAVFDSRIISNGGLAVEVAPEWRPYVDAMNPEFLFRFADSPAWVSLYLPGNAFLRALVSKFVDPAWTGPLLVILATAATFSVARMLWPQRIDAAFFAATLVVTAPQVLVTAMTPYAMTAHLALNMLWLWLLLHDRHWSHAAAVIIGWLATGLHQIVFHPLFVAPFILQLWFQQRRRLAAFYVFSYALVGLFWIAYKQMLQQFLGLQLPLDATMNTTDILVIASDLLSNFNIFGINTMIKNLIRMLSWQNLAIAPFAVLALANWRRLPPTLLSLLAGLTISTLVMLALMPYQGHGWGYRYLHGFIGSLALLAAFGWVQLTGERGSSQTRAIEASFLIATLATILILLPTRALQARAFAEPYARAHARIIAADADVVIVDRTGLMFAIDLVRNDPLLKERPKILDLGTLKEDQLDAICRNFKVAVFDQKTGLEEGMPAYDSDTEFDKRRKTMREQLRRLGCGNDLAGKTG